MKYIYIIDGMTCGGCVASVTKKLLDVKGVSNAEVQLETSEAQIKIDDFVDVSVLQSALGTKYTIQEKTKNFPPSERLLKSIENPSKLKQLKPLLLIFLYLFSAAFLLNFKEWNVTNAMLDFMGLFYIVFSFFKLLDLKGFPESFKMYDPLAKLIPAYGWVYPFIELALGLFFLMRFQIPVALGVTIVILGITTIGVIKTLLDKKSIRCACLGTALKLPMTEATFIENAIMLVMAVVMLVKYVNL
ncbi:MauE/DoxX family redox-associated membrane protein [uncultured Maribacter sp.]|uniref:heavy-metal-associated domain-containing protein n=1 Tax=uncultured Maribacter sp. TaxID=431308 RepID=UPI002634FF33|nr:MauE/DoxX family redox-associated membrane protein [uncultured Maribacter sp.]